MYLHRYSNPSIHPTFQYFVTAANEDPRVASGRCAGNSKEKGPTEMGPLTFHYTATLVVVRVFELRHRLKLLLGAAHHGMVGSPVIRVGAARGRGRRRRGSIRWRRGSPGRRFARRGRGR